MEEPDTGKGKIEFDFKLRLKKDGAFILSEGRAALLSMIQETGSIKEAALKMKMSYRHAWGQLKKMETAAGYPLVESTRGGRDKGSTNLTQAALDLIHLFEARKQGIIQILYNEGAPSGKPDSNHPRNPYLTVDAVLEKGGKILLIRRGNPPYKDCWAIPGGFVDYGESVEVAVSRELLEETGISAKPRQLLSVQSDPLRDPRGHTASVVFIMENDFKGDAKGSDDAKDARWWPLDRLPPMAFDHGEVIRKAIPHLTGN